MTQIKMNKRVKSILSIQTADNDLLTLQENTKSTLKDLEQEDSDSAEEDIIVINPTTYPGSYAPNIIKDLTLKHLERIVDICLKNMSNIAKEHSMETPTYCYESLEEIGALIENKNNAIQTLKEQLSTSNLKSENLQQYLIRSGQNVKTLIEEKAELEGKLFLLKDDLKTAEKVANDLRLDNTLKDNMIMGLKMNETGHIVMVKSLEEAKATIQELEKVKRDQEIRIEELIVQNTELTLKLSNFENTVQDKKRKYVPELNVLGLIGAIEIIVLLSLILFGTKTCSNNTETVSGTTDSIHIYRDSLNNEVSYRQSLEASNAESVLKLKTKDSTILKLQSSISNMKGDVKKLKAVVLFNNATIYELKDSLRNKIVAIDSTADSAYPVYNRIVKDEWINADITLGLSKFDFKLKVKNEFDVKFTEEPDGFLNTKTIVTVVNKNPYTYTTDLISYNVKTQKTKVPFYTTASGIVLGAILGGLLF